MLNKKGADLIIVIIWLVLGILVAAFLIWGFSTNWSMFSSLFAGNNVNIITTQCQTACATSDVYSFCSMKRTLKAEDLPVQTGKEGKVRTVTNTCSYFALSPDSSQGLDYAVYGISDCPGLCPNAPPTAIQ